MKRNINDVKTWPPGTIMLFDNYDVRDRGVDVHRGFGLVVSNNGTSSISVLWDAESRDALAQYEVKFLNPAVIRRG